MIAVPKLRLRQEKPKLDEVVAQTRGVLGGIREVNDVLEPWTRAAEVDDDSRDTIQLTPRFMRTPRVCAEKLPQTIGSLRRARSRLTSPDGSTLGVMAAMEEIDNVANMLRSQTERLEEALAVAQLAGSPMASARAVLEEMIAEAIMLAARCHSTQNATGTGAALAVMLRTAKRFQAGGDPIQTKSAESVMAELFVRVLKPVWTLQRTARNTLTHTNDLMSLPHLNANTLRDALKQRFTRGVPYTYAGDVLVSVNPCRDMGNMCEAILLAYRSTSRYDPDDLGTRAKLPPHLFKLADEVLTHVQDHPPASGSSTHTTDGSLLNHAIIISGESGAGVGPAALIHCNCAPPVHLSPTLPGVICAYPYPTYTPTPTPTLLADRKPAKPNI